MLAATPAHAAPHCELRADNPYGPAAAVLTQPLLVQALTVGPDVPDGTIVYQQLTDLQPFAIACTGGPGAVELRADYGSRPQPLSAWSGGPQAGRVYESGLPGIGVFIEEMESGTALPASRSLPLAAASADLSGKQAQLRLSLVKIGPVAPGIVSGAQLPGAEVRLAGLPLMRLSFSGSLQIVSPTCVTPDLHVAMGSHRAGEFTGPGSVTGWKRFEVRLENCPAFHGASAFVVNSHSGGSGWQFSGATRSNEIGYLLSATTPMVGAPSQGIVSLSPARRGGTSATGIDLQLGRPDGTPHGFDQRYPSGISPRSAVGAGYAILLAARYVQTGDAVTPGEANASVILTIDYQ